jgi:hypothetical protein
VLSGYQLSGTFIHQYSQFLAAVDTVAGKQVQQLCIDGTPNLDVGAAMVADLGRAVGITLAHLELVDCRMSPDFWPPVWARLPGLKTLTVSGKSSVLITSQDVASFCSSATHPLQLLLDQDLYTRYQQREQQPDIQQGEPLVTVKQHG